MVGFTTPRASTARISGHVARVLVVAQGEAKCVCIPGWRGLLDERRDWLNASGSVGLWSRRSIRTTNLRCTDGNRHRCLWNLR